MINCFLKKIMFVLNLIQYSNNNSLNTNMLNIQMKTLRHFNIENRQNYFFNTMTNIKNFDPHLLSTDQISLKITDCFIYDISKILTIKIICLVFNNVDAYIECNSTKENNEDKYFVFALTNKNKEALENYTELWDEIKDQIELISSNKPTEYKKDFMKIKFKSDDNLPLGKILNIPVYVILVRSVFQKNYYPQIFYMSVFMSMNMN